MIGGTIYAGTGLIGKLFAIDSVTGVKQEIPLPAQYSSCSWVYELAATDSELYAQLHCDGVTAGHVYSPATGTWSPSLGVFGSQRVGASADGREWFVSDGRLASRTRAGVVSVTTFAFGPKGNAVITDSSGAEWVIGLTAKGLLNRHRIGSSTADTVDPGMPASAVHPRTLGVGPDGNLHVSGAVAGGLATYCASSGVWGKFQGDIAQAEGIAAHDGSLYLGIYTGARIFRWASWRACSTPSTALQAPVRMAELRGLSQDRPFALASIKPGLLAVGTVPDYGHLGGHLTLINTTSAGTGTTNVVDLPGALPKSGIEIVDDQSVLALQPGPATADGSPDILYGGTGIYGGLGVNPTASDAVVFAFGLDTLTERWRVTIPGESAVTALTLDGDGMLWAATAGKVYQIDPDTQSIVREVVVASFDWSTVVEASGVRAGLAYSTADGTIHGSLRGKIVRINPMDGTFETLQGAQGKELVLRSAASGGSPGNTDYWLDGGRLKSVTWPSRAASAISATISSTRPGSTSRPPTSRV